MIRKAEKADLDQISQIYFEVQALHVELEPNTYKTVDRAQLLADLEKLLEREDSVWLLVAEIKFEITGYAIARLVRSPGHLLMHPFESLFIEQIAVKKTCQRQGIGKQLLLEVKAIAQQVGAERIDLVVIDGNEAARKFYRARGFSLSNEQLSFKL